MHITVHQCRSPVPHLAYRLQDACSYNELNLVPDPMHRICYVTKNVPAVAEQCNVSVSISLSYGLAINSAINSAAKR